jgi:hypothetical protein
MAAARSEARMKPVRRDTTVPAAITVLAERMLVLEEWLTGAAALREA